eukprot:m.108703 g.108703  ORF g.108703 m.108703 type:complete len:880 (-) comp9193_c0_seq4:748-3387(-)
MRKTAALQKKRDRLKAHDKYYSSSMNNNKGKKSRIVVNNILQKRLVNACQRCDAAMILSVLERSPHSVDVNLVDESGMTPLMICAANDSSSSISALSSSSRLDINQRVFETGDTALHVAVEHGCVIAVKALIDFGASTNIRNNHGNTPLHTAVICNRPEFLMMILNARTNTEIANGAGLTPLAIATLENNVLIVRILVRKGADPLTQNTNDQFTAFHVACAANQVDILDIFEKELAKETIRELLLCQDKHGRTPLHVAVLDDLEEVTSRLLDLGANPLIEDESGRDCYQLAINNNNTSILKLLMSKNEEVSKSFVLHRAASVGDQACVQYLALSVPTDVSHQDTEGNTPLHIALLNDREDVASYLAPLSYEIIDVANNEGSTPLHLAVDAGFTGIVSKLIEIGVKLQMEDGDGNTPLILAIRNNNRDVYDVLVKTGMIVPENYLHENNNNQTAVHFAAMSPRFIDVLALDGVDEQNLNKMDASGFTPLIYAVSNKNMDAMKILIEKGASVNASTKEKLTPLHLAAHNDDLDISLYLISHGAHLNPISIKDHTPLDVAYHANAFKTSHILFENGGRVCLMLRHFAAIKVQTVWRSQRSLRDQFDTNLSTTEHGMFLYMCKCMLATIRLHFFLQARDFHAKMLKLWRQKKKEDQDEKGFKEFLKWKHNRQGKLPAKQPSTSTVLSLPPILNINPNKINKNKHDIGGAHEAKVISDEGEQKPDSPPPPENQKELDALFCDLRKSFSMVDGDLRKALSKHQTNLHANDSECGNDEDARSDYEHKLTTIELSPQLEMQQRMLSKFRNRFEKLQETMRKREEALATRLPSKDGCKIGTEEYKDREKQKKLRLEMKEALQDIVKLRSDAESLSKLVQTKENGAEHL